VQTRRTLAGAVSASSSAAVEPNQHSAGADASTSAIPFDELSPAAQICALTNDEMVETVLSCWWPRETYLSLIRDFTLDELRQVCGRLKCMAAGGRHALRTSIIHRIERWAKDNPLLVPLDASDDPPRTRSDGIKAAKAAAVAQSRSSKVTYSEDDGGASTEHQSGADASDADSDYSPPKRSSARGRSPARAASQHTVSKHALRKELADALASMPSVSASPSAGSRDSIRSGRRMAAAAVAPVAASGRSRRSRRRDSSSSSDSPSSSDSDIEEDAYAFVTEEEDCSSRYLSSRRSSDRKSSSGSKSGRDPFLSGWFDNVLRDADSVSDRFTSVTAKWSSERNRKEAMVLAKIIDHLRLGQIHQAMDKAVRRIVGVHTAESSGSWTLSNVLENNTEAQSFLPDRAWSAAVKMAARLESMRKSAQNVGGSGSFAGKDKSKSSGGSSSSSNSYGQGRDRSSGAHDAKSTGSNK